MWRGERDFLLGLFEPSFQILHGFRSWVFIDNFIHYAPKILHTDDTWKIWGAAWFLYKIWQVFFAPCVGGLGCVCWCPVLDQRHVAIAGEQFSLVCCFIHIFTYGEGQASLVSVICCWCSNRQSKSVLGVKKCIPVRPHPVIPSHVIHFELFLTWYAGGT